MPIVGMIVYAVGIGIAIIGGLWLLVTVFRTGILWGLAVVFLPFAGFVYLAMHWEQARRPFLAQLLGVVIGAIWLWGWFSTSPWPWCQSHQELGFCLLAGFVGIPLLIRGYKFASRRLDPGQLIRILVVLAVAGGIITGLVFAVIWIFDSFWPWCKKSPIELAIGASVLIVIQAIVHQVRDTDIIRELEFWPFLLCSFFVAGVLGTAGWFAVDAVYSVTNSGAIAIGLLIATLSSGLALIFSFGAD